MIQKISSGFLSTFALAKITPRINKQVKDITRELGEEEYTKAIDSEESMTEFAMKVFNRLSDDLKNKIPLQQFLGIVVSQRAIALKRAKNKKVLKKIADKKAA
jgi:sulfite reductase alpha subunit-like flavoprotein